MESASKFATALISRGFITKILHGKTIEALHDFVDELFSGGFLSYEDYRRIIFELVEASKLSGEAKEEKLREIEKMILNAIRHSESIGEKIDIEDIHMQVEELFSGGFLSYEDYRRIIFELVEASKLSGEAKEEKLREIEKMIRNAKKEF